MLRKIKEIQADIFETKRLIPVNLKIDSSKKKA